MEEMYNRTRILAGDEGVERLKGASVLVMGVGGVGSYAAEAIGRAGIGKVTLMDGDSAQASNLNRQLVALTSTLGKSKAEVMADRIRDINPDAEVTAIPEFYKTGEEIDLTQFDWIIDAIDDVDAKTELIRTDFIVEDISKTQTCPLAKVMRKRLRAIGVEHLPVVYSKEKPAPRTGELGTLSYVPGSMGLTLAGYVIRQIAGICD